MAKGDILESTLPNGSIYTEIDGYGGETDFYRIFDIMNEVVEPDTSRFGVDSLCVMGTFVKDDIHVRMSSEGISDNVAFQFDARGLGEEQADRVRGWIKAIAARL